MHMIIDLIPLKFKSKFLIKYESGMDSSNDIFEREYKEAVYVTMRSHLADQEGELVLSFLVCSWKLEMNYSL